MSQGRIRFSLLFICIFPLLPCFSQDLMDELDTGEGPVRVGSLFKGSRIINTPTTKVFGKGTLEFLIQHRFGALNTGINEFFGLDQAQIRLELSYVPVNNLMIGIGRSSFEKVYDGYLKYQLFHQETGEGAFPLSVTLYSYASINTVDYPENLTGPERLAYFHQVLMARKLSDRITLLIAPAFLHRNYVFSSDFPNDIFGVTAGGRIKITSRISVTGEYHYIPGKQQANQFHNSVGLGFNIETGGHVFQLHFVNSRSMAARQYFAENTSDLRNGDIHFGFNISRVFAL